MAPPSESWMYLRATVAMLLLLGIMGVVLWRQRGRSSSPGPRTPGLPRWLRSLAPVSGDSPLRVVHSRRLAMRASVHVLSWNDKEWLLACTDQTVTVIAERTAPASARSTPQPPSNPAPASPRLEEKP